MDKLLQDAETALTNWVDPSVRARVASTQETVVAWFNPELTGYKTPVEGWPFQSLLSAAVVVSVYLGLICLLTLVVKIFGKSKDDMSSSPKSVLQKFTSEPILILAAMYNLCQVLLCAYMASGALVEAKKREYSFICNGFDKSASGMAGILWVFYMSKVLDFADTLFIILRKKWRQLSFLHVYHHSTIFLIYWLNLNAGYDGDIYYTIALNSSIHFIMYGYYFLRTFNVPVPTVFKLFVTNMQLIQFVTMIGQAVYLTIFSCAYPPKLVYLYFVYILTMIALFSNFKRATYSKKKAKSD